MSLSKRMHLGRRKRSGTEGVAEKLLKNKAEVLAILLVIIMASIVLYLTTHLDYAGVGDEAAVKAQDSVPQEVQGCMQENPYLLEQNCWDSYYHERAVAEGDETLCARIVDEGMRQHCERYF